MANIPSPRKPWIALLLSIVQPTLGQIYNGQFAKGLSIAILTAVSLAICSYLQLFAKFSSMLFVVVLWVTLFIYLLVDSYLTAKRLPDFVPSRWNRWYFYLAFIIVAQSILEIERSSIKSHFRAFKVPSASMAPTLNPGDHIIADMRAFQDVHPSRGEIIIFAYPEDRTKDFMKRVIGLPGETITIQEKHVFINGQQFVEPPGVRIDPVIHPWEDSKTHTFGPAVVPDDAYFVLGDNREHSLDSRFWGFLSKRDLKGKAIYVYWSSDLSKIGNPVK